MAESACPQTETDGLSEQADCAVLSMCWVWNAEIDCVVASLGRLDGGSFLLDGRMDVVLYDPSAVASLL